MAPYGAIGVNLDNLMLTQSPVCSVSLIVFPKMELCTSESNIVVTHVICTCVLDVYHCLYNIMIGVYSVYIKLHRQTDVQTLKLNVFQ